MQTFLPYSDFKKSAKCLDDKRLGKQRVEAMQILNVLVSKRLGKIYKQNGKKIGWLNHPAVKMWQGYENSLKLYMKYCIQEWTSRGFKNKIIIPICIPKNIDHPTWLGNEKLHSSHRSNLLRKKFDFYNKYKWKESTDLPYFWPK